MGFEKQKTEIKDICKRLLDEGEFKVILGFASGENGGSSIPLFIRKESDIDSFNWDNSCTPTLAKYVLEKKEKVAIVAKPCDARALVMYIVEKQLVRDNLYIIGVECAGMQGTDGLPSSGCDRCKVRIPPIFDILVKSDENVQALASSVKENTKQSELIDNLTRFQKEMEKCILCFTCRQVCYGCYCKTCFMDKNLPSWLPKELDAGSKIVFHLTRAMHLAGRCVECGACERACASGVDIRYLISEVTDFCKELYGYEAGMSLDDVPAMFAFNIDDKEIGFLGGESHECSCDTEKPNK